MADRQEGQVARQAAQPSGDVLDREQCAPASSAATGLRGGVVKAGRQRAAPFARSLEMLLVCVGGGEGCHVVMPVALAEVHD